MAAHKIYAVCSKPGCNYGTIFRDEDLRYGCARCGAELIFNCPHCGLALRNHKEPVCDECLRPLKEAL